MSGSNPESGWLIGSTQGSLPGGTVLSGEGSALWPDMPHIVKGGDWRREELRTIEHPLGRAVVMGECLATQSELQAAVHTALTTENPAALASLPGSYTSIVLDKHGAHFVGDAASQHPLYVRPDDGTVQFSTHTKPFRSGSKAAPPDRLSLAIGVGMPWINELQTDRTPLEGVLKALPQQVIHADNDGSVRKTRHDSMVPERPLTVEEASERLRAAMQIGAERRADLGLELSADFSGGYDSTSVAYFLANAVDKPLMVATQYSPDVPLDDFEYVQRYLALPESAGKFEHHVFEGRANKMTYKDLGTIEAGDVPDISINVRGRYEEYFAFLRTLGSELHIMGSGADELIDMPPRQYLGRLANVSTLPYFIRAVFQVARAEKDSPRNVVADSMRVAGLNPKSRLLQLAHILQTPGTYKGALIADIFGAGTAPYWLTRSVRNEIAAYAAEVADSADIPVGMDPANYRAYSELLVMNSSQAGMRQAAARNGLRLSAIFFDNDVLQACLGLPAHKRMSPWVFKQLMGRAFAGIVPSEVTSRKTKGDYTKYAFEGLRESQDFLRTMMKNSRLADLGIIDPAKVNETLENGFSGANMPLPSLDMMIATELWLASLDNESWSGRTSYMALPTPEPVSMSTAQTAKIEPLNTQAVYGMPEGVIAVTRINGSAVIINMPARRYQSIRPDTVQILRALQEGGSVAAAYNNLARMYTGVPRDVLEGKAEACIRDLIDKGILSQGDTKYTLLGSNLDQATIPPSQMIPAVERTPDVRLRDYAAAFGGLVLGHILQKEKSFERRIKFLNTLRSKLASKVATPEEAIRLLAATRRLSRVHLGRAACLELSMATVLASALRGRQSNLVLGVRSDPESFHAWPQVGDIPIRTDADEPIVGVYQPLIKL